MACTAVLIIPCAISVFLAVSSVGSEFLGVPRSDLDIESFEALAHLTHPFFVHVWFHLVSIVGNQHSLLERFKFGLKGHVSMRLTIHCLINLYLLIRLIFDESFAVSCIISFNLFILSLSLIGYLGRSFRLSLLVALLLTRELRHLVTVRCIFGANFCMVSNHSLWFFIMGLL